jgi:NAD(P)-dependent dehydrogenase (short-subunit alcohol dehydrogenase family)
MRMDDLEAALTGKLVAYLSVLQAALPRLRADGSVTFIGANVSAAALPATAGLAAVNGGLDAAVRPLAVEPAPLRINVVAPGVIQTGRRRGRRGAADRQRLRHRHADPLRRRIAAALRLLR